MTGQAPPASAVLRQVGWILVALGSTVVAVYGLWRLTLEFGYSPLHYVGEDALFAIVGLLGIQASVTRLKWAAGQGAPAPGAAPWRNSRTGLYGTIVLVLAFLGLYLVVAFGRLG